MYLSKLEKIFWKGEAVFRRMLLIFFVGTIYSILLYKREVPLMTPLMMIRTADKITQGNLMPIKYSRVPLQYISKNMVYGVIAGEDQKFLEHFGFDFQALWNALEHNIQTQSTSVGGSTITQQTAKNLFLRPGRSLVRKAFEGYLTLVMEIIRSKQRIIEIYLNIIEFGDGIYGVQQAAQYYFHTSADKLTQSQASFLVAMMPNPRYYQDHKTSYTLLRRKSAVNRSISSIKRNKEIKTYIEARYP